jgi:hypothetical protein
MSANARPRRVPGTRLRALAVALFDRATAERILLPAVADLQHEVTEAHGGSRGARAVVRWRCYLAFWRTFAACLALRTSPNQSRAWGHQAFGGVAVLVVLTAGLVYGPISRSGAALGSLALWLVPQALAVSIPSSVLGAGFLGRWSRGRADGDHAAFLRGMVVYSVLATMLSFVVVAWLVPSANYGFRQRAYIVQTRLGPLSAGIHIPKGYPEMTVGELLEARRKAVLRFDGPYTWRLERERAGYYLHLKGALPAASVALGLLAVALAPWRCRQRFPGVAGLALGVLTLFVYYLVMHWSRWLVWAMVAPAWLGAWGPPALFAGLALAMVWGRVARAGSLKPGALEP